MGRELLGFAVLSPTYFSITYFSSVSVRRPKSTSAKVGVDDNQSVLFVTAQAQLFAMNHTFRQLTVERM